MRASAELFNLIHALTPSEKRYFKIFATSQSQKSNNYLKVFEELEKQKSYNEQRLLEKMGAGKFRKQLPVVKHYLYRLILKSLRNYHAGETVEIQLGEQLINVHLLTNKGLIDQAGKMLDKAEKLALEHEFYEYLIRIELLRVTLLIRSRHDNLEQLSKDIETSFQRQQKHYQQFLTIHTYRMHSLRMLLLNRKEQRVRSDASLKQYQTLYQQLNSETYQELPIKAQLFYLQAIQIFHFAAGNKAGHYEYAEKIVQHMEAHPQMIDESPANYLSSLQNLAMAATETREAEEALTKIALLHTIRKRYPKIRLDKRLERAARLYAWNLELYNLLKNNNIQEAQRRIPEMEAWLQEQKLKVNTNEGFILVDLWYHVARIALASGNYTKGLEYVEKILTTEGLSDQYEMYLNARLLQVMLYYELEDSDRLDTALLSLYRFLKRQDRLHGFEKTLLGFIRKLVRVYPGSEEMKTILSRLRNELAAIRENPYEEHGLINFDLIAWLDEKINKSGTKPQ